jgi:hypothetical protein
MDNPVSWRAAHTEFPWFCRSTLDQTHGGTLNVCQIRNVETLSPNPQQLMDEKNTKPKVNFR